MATSAITKMEFLHLSFKNGWYKRRNWVLSATALTEIGDKKMEFVVHRNAGYVYFMAGSQDEIIISDAKKDEPLFGIHDKIEVLFGILSNVEKPTITTVGNLLFNACVIDYAFGNKLGYLNNRKTANINYLEKVIAERFTSGKVPEVNTDKSKIYTEEYLRYAEGVEYLKGFNFNYCVCVSEKLLSVPPNNAELKRQLVAAAGDKIGQPAVLAGVYTALDENDKKFLEGDIATPFMNGKIRVARRKMFLMQGGEAGLTGGDSYDVSTNSLSEGIEIAKFASANNVLRAGSLNRGYETQLGGVATKEIIRATSNIRIVKGDCGTRMGRIVYVHEGNIKRQLLGLSINLPGGAYRTINNMEEAGEYMGKFVTRRSPQYCKSSGENFCEVCVGTRLARHPKGVSMAMTEIGGIILGIFMSMMHAKELKVHKVSLDSVTQ